ncbi:MAG: helix-turn-helix transcriptional regulator [Acidobacteria bacterium]|nr:helix-turn-helix transcriptional regulator [Acidobacteriota bacterium]
MNLGESIRKIRQVKGLSQGEMQKRTGILRSYLSRVENGHTVPSFATLQRLASAMEVTLADFFAMDGGPTSSSPTVAGANSDYLQELKGYLPYLSTEQRQELLAMIKEMARAARQ